MAKGGYRENAGRPKGARSKLQIADFLTEKEIKELVGKAKELAKMGDKDMLKFILEQKFGKARQNIGLDGGEDGTPIGVVILPKKNASTLGADKQAE